MANKNTIAIELIVNDNGSVTIKQFGSEAEKSLGNVEKAGPRAAAGMDTLQKSFTDLAIKATAAWMAVNKAMEYAELGAKAEQAEESFRSVAQSVGESADSIIADMGRAAAGTVDDSDIMQKAIKGMLQGFSGDEMIHIMEAARVAARVTGEDVKTAYEKITDAISTNMPRALRQYGLIAKDEIALVNRAMAAGVEDINLYDIAMAHAALQAAKMGEMSANAAEGVQRFHATINDVKESVGKLSISISTYMLAGMYGLDAAVVNAAAGLAKYTFQTDTHNKLVGLANDLTKQRNALLGIQTEEEKKAAAEAAKSAKENIAAAEEKLKAEREKLKAIADQAEQTKALQKAYESLSAIMQKLDEDRLKFAGDGFAEILKKENITIAQMSKGLETYLATLESVYNTRIAGEKEIAAALERSGAKPAEQMKIQGELLKIEKEANEQRLAGWKQYFDALAAQHAKATDAMKTKTQELAAIEAKAADAKRVAVDDTVKLTEKLMIAQGKQANDAEIFYMKQAASEALLQQAKTQTGEAQIKTLEAYKASQMELTGEVVKYEKERDMWSTGYVTKQKTIQTAEQSIVDVTKNVAEANLLIKQNIDAAADAKKREIETVKDWEAKLKTAMESAKKEMDDYTNKVIDLSRQISEMDKNIALTVDTAMAQAAVSGFKIMWDSIQSKTITLTVNTVNTVNGKEGGGGGNDGTGGNPGIPPTGGGYTEFAANGLAFDRGNVIPFASGGIFDRPTLFPMAKGFGLMGEAGTEAIMPLTRGSDGKLGVKASGGGALIDFHPTINIRGQNKSPEQIVDETIRIFRTKMRNLDARVN